MPLISAYCIFPNLMLNHNFPFSKLPCMKLQSPKTCAFHRKHHWPVSTGARTPSAAWMPPIHPPASSVGIPWDDWEWQEFLGATTIKLNYKTYQNISKYCQYCPLHLRTGSISR